MARYIDADKMIDGESTTFPYNLDYCDDGDLMEWLNAQPTADVVPRAMIAEMFGEIDALFARFYDDPSYSSGELGYDIEELKKKYTEQ